MLDLKLSIGAAAVRQRRAAAPAPPAPVTPITSVAADGWSATYPSPPAFAPDTAPETVTLSRQGFDAAGQAVTISEALTVTARVRQPYPNQGQLTSNKVALSDYVYATDTIAGVTNGSAETSPKPVANWIMPHRTTVGNAIDLEIVAFHRNARSGRQVACVVFRATDGTNIVSQIVAGTVISGHLGDLNPVVSYKCTLDISALSDNAVITCNAKVYPWIGGAASILDSADQTAAREFSPRKFVKNTARAAAPYYVYVSASGNDSTGTVSTNAATAAATPCLTINGAIARLVAVNGNVDYGIIRVTAGTFAGPNSGTARAQALGLLIVERDPATAAGAAIVSITTSTMRPNLTGQNAAFTTGAMMFRDLAFVRTTTTVYLVTGEGTKNLDVFIENCTLDNNGSTTGLISNAQLWVRGLTVTNVTASGVLAAATGEIRLLRGVSADLAYGALENWLTVGCSITRCGVFLRFSTRSYSGGIAAFNTFPKVLGTSGFINIADSSNVDGFALVQNLIETTTTNNQPAIRVSADNATGSTTHVILHNNSRTGFAAYGRDNLFYDEGTTPRTHKLMSVVGEIACQMNTKGDIFVGTNNNGTPDPTGAPTRTGNWAFLYGVGCRGIFSQYVDAAGGQQGFRQEYPGLKASIGASSTVRNDPLFANYQGTTNSGSTAVAGAGGGTYALQSASPAKGRVASAVLSHGLAGNARAAANDSTGAYA